MIILIGNLMMGAGIALAFGAGKQGSYPLLFVATVVATLGHIITI